MKTIIKHLFGSEKEFIDYVMNQEISLIRKEEIINHEKAHYIKAKELGYDSKYCIEIKRNRKLLFIFKECLKIEYKVVVEYGKEINVLDSMKIALAPSKPSKSDWNKFEECLNLINNIKEERNSKILNGVYFK